METQTLIEDILNGDTGPLVEYDPEFGVHQYSALVDILVELDPEESNGCVEDDVYAFWHPRARQEETYYVRGLIQKAVEALRPGTYFCAAHHDGVIHYGIWTS